MVTWACLASKALLPPRGRDAGPGAGSGGADGVPLIRPACPARFHSRLPHTDRPVKPVQAGSRSRCVTVRKQAFRSLLPIYWYQKPVMNNSNWTLI